MTTSYTSLLGLALPVQGELDGTWGDTVNNSITSLLDSAVAGTTTLSTDADVTLTTTTGVANTAREAVLLCTGARTAITYITAPAHSKTYTVINATTGGYVVYIRGVGPTTGIAVPMGYAVQVAWNGSDFVQTSVPVTKISGLGTGVATFLATPSSANLAAALTDETGSGSAVFATSPTLVTPILGTPQSATLTNATGLPLTTGVTGTLPIANGGTNSTAAATAGGVGYGTGTAHAYTAAGTTGQILTSAGAGVPAWTSTLPVDNGGTGSSTLTLNNVLLGNGTSALQVVAPGTSGNILTSNGTTWTSSVPAPGGITYSKYTSNVTTVDKQGVIADTTAGTFTVTLPATPSTGNQVVVVDGGNWAVNNLIIGRNGSTIESIAEDMTVDIGGVAITFIYNGTTWDIYAQLGVVPTSAGVFTSVNVSSLSASNVVFTDAGKNLTSSGIVSIANGGTNSTATATAGGAGYGTGTAHAYTAAGTAGQVLTSNAGAAPTWQTIVTALSVVVVSGTTQTAVANTQYVLTNVAATTVTLPASPASGDTVWVTVANSLATNVIARNAQTIMGLAEDLTINWGFSTVQLRFVNSSWRIL